VFQNSVVPTPGPALGGFAKNELITGALGGGSTVAVAFAVTDPNELVAVSV
jgi:hypothetical protein